ncbi:MULTISPECIES: hypothetical protein [Nocardiaceae]|uniref:Uncharacterized protein n=1 Tax=Rhodococcoides corynebacterioides TaxID=53972 RepID=A0ABS2KWE6_9NOCA|nr:MULTISPECIES: hypothetical protein [Rhodococcus]MBM7416253.1 hypothetical protein [Rhodococcus corynebacterioides]MBP1114506.1 hypothetical protein [Rhodococcus sp. PvP016]
MELTLNDFTIKGPSTVGQGSNLVVSDEIPAAQAVVPGDVSWLDPFSPTVQITLDGDRQPGAPLRLEYRLPQGASASGPDGAVPVVVSRSADGSVDMVEARVEGDTMTADLGHLSWDVFAWFKPEEVVRELTEVVKPILGTGSPKPDCVDKPLTYPNLIKTVAPVEGNVAWMCIYDTPGLNTTEPSTSIGITINSPFAWRLSANPRALKVVLTDTDSGNQSLRALYRKMADTDQVAGPGDTVQMNFGQYEQGPRTGTLTRNSKMDAIALTAWAYEEVLQNGPFKGVFAALDVGPELVKCSGTRTDVGLGQWGADLKSCAQGLGAAVVRLVIGKTGVAFGAYLSEALSKTPTSATWTITSQTRTEQANQAPTSTWDGTVVLGRADDQYSVGYGTSKPETVSLNSLCANTISNIDWSTWGGSEAKGRGQLCAPAGSPESGGPVELTATDLGDCNGASAYRKLLIGGKQGWDICN